MGSEEWRRKVKNAKPTLASWCDNNCNNPKIAGLVADGEASTRVVEILKSYQARSALLSGPQKTGLMGELFGAGQWSAAAGKRETPQQPPPPSRRAAFSDDAKSSRSYASVAADAKEVKEAGANRADAALRQKLQEAERKLAAALKANVSQEKALRGQAAVNGPADDPMSDEGWDCVACGADHTRSKKKACRICAHSRAAENTQANVPTTRSPEAVAAERAVLLQKKEALPTFGFTPALLSSAIKEVEAQLRCLDEPAAVVAEATPYDLLEKARVANDKADAHHEGLADKATEIQERISALHRDLNAVVRALANAEQEQMRTRAALVAATDALPAAKPNAQATSSAPAAREDGFTQHARAELMQAITQSLVNMISEELTQATGEKDKESFLHRMMAKLAGSGSQPTETSAPPAAPPQATVTPPQPTPAAPTSEAPAPAVAAPVEADSDGSRMPQRVTLKTAAMEQDANAPSLRRHAEAAKQTKQERDSRIAAGRA